MAEAFKELADAVDAPAAEVELGPFSHACFLVSPLFGCLGIAFNFAEMDYFAKVHDLGAASKSIVTLQGLLDRHVEGNCVRKAGSHSRNLLRWPRHVFKMLFEQILATTDELSVTARIIYCGLYGHLFEEILTTEFLSCIGKLEYLSGSLKYNGKVKLLHCNLH